MNKYALAALAITAAGTPAAAGTDPWSSTLDRDFAALASKVAPASSSGITVKGFLRSSFVTSDDTLKFNDADSDDFVDGGELQSNDLGGLSINDARLTFVGTLGNFGLTVAIDGTRGTREVTTDEDGAGATAPVTNTLYSDHSAYGQNTSLGTVEMLDAFATYKFNDQLRLQVGRFRTPFLASALRDEDEMLFIDRSLLGTAWAQRDEGIQLSGTFPLGNDASWGYALSAQDGNDSDADKASYAARIHLTPIGSPSRTEGAVGAPNEPALSLGVSYFDDENSALARNGTLSTRDAIAMGIDATFTYGQFCIGGEAVEYNDAFGIEVPGSAGTLTEILVGNRPFSVMASYLIVDGKTPIVELGIRFEDLDDDDKSTIQTIGANWYISGHDAKVQLNFSSADSDEIARQMDVVQIGLSISL